ncbi:MAG: hypothetical protein EAX96_01375 [Candidatus Lokiarchaeota archaeon]|nr:hypothetical protein [Candidatus Lokiarchaeota archaeon]
MGRGGDSSKPVIFAGIIGILACFLPWWLLFGEAIPSSGGSSYIIYLGNPFGGNYINILSIFTGDGSWINTIISNAIFLDTDVTANVSLLIAVIISLIGGVIAIISMGKNKVIAIIGGVLLLAGAALYILFIALGIVPPGIKASFFTDNNLNLIAGQGTQEITLWGRFDFFYSISFGCIICLIAGIIVLIASLRIK